MLNVDADIMIKDKDIVLITMIIQKMIGKNIETYGKKEVTMGVILKADLIVMNMMKKKVMNGRNIKIS
jgi:hypothetical protein